MVCTLLCSDEGGWWEQAEIEQLTFTNNKYKEEKKQSTFISVLIGAYLVNGGSNLQTEAF